MAEGFWYDKVAEEKGDQFSEGVKPNYDAMIEHMITSLYVMALIREFKKVKVYYFKHNQETVFREMENYEEIIKNQNEQLLKANLETNKLRSERDMLRKNKIESEKLLRGELAKSQKPLKEEIPHLMIYEGNMPEKATAIFIDYKQISHSDYYEVIGWAKRKKMPYHFIQSKGVGETIAEMAVTLKNCES